MVRTLFDSEARAEIQSRIRHFAPTAQRQWGTMSPSAALAHLVAELRLTFGELQPTSAAPLLARWPLNYLAIYVIPWPRGKGKAVPEVLPPASSSWQVDQQALVGLVERFAHADPAGHWPMSPAFGVLSGKDWGVLSYKHLDHHLRQFGC